MCCLLAPSAPPPALQSAPTHTGRGAGHSSKPCRQGAVISALVPAAMLIKSRHAEVPRQVATGSTACCCVGCLVLIPAPTLGGKQQCSSKLTRTWGLGLGEEKSDQSQGAGGRGQEAPAWWGCRARKGRSGERRGLGFAWWGVPSPSPTGSTLPHQHYTDAPMNSCSEQRAALNPK